MSCARGGPGRAPRGVEGDQAGPQRLLRRVPRPRSVARETASSSASLIPSRASMDALPCALLGFGWGDARRSQRRFSVMSTTVRSCGLRASTLTTQAGTFASHVSVGRRDEHVGGAVSNEHGHGDPIEGKAPRVDDGEIVATQPATPVAARRRPGPDDLMRSGRASWSIRLAQLEVPRTVEGTALAPPPSPVHARVPGTGHPHRDRPVELLDFSGSWPASQSSRSSPGVPSGATPTVHVARRRVGKKRTPARGAHPRRPSSLRTARNPGDRRARPRRRPRRRLGVPVPTVGATVPARRRDHAYPEPPIRSSSGHRSEPAPRGACSDSTGNPSGSPHTANATVRPSRATIVLRGSPSRDDTTPGPLVVGTGSVADHAAGDEARPFSGSRGRRPRRSGRTPARSRWSRRPRRSRGRALRNCRRLAMPFGDLTLQKVRTSVVHGRSVGDHHGAPRRSVDLAEPAASPRRRSSPARAAGPADRASLAVAAFPRLGSDRSPSTAILAGNGGRGLQQRRDRATALRG